MPEIHIDVERTFRWIDQTADIGGAASLKGRTQLVGNFEQSAFSVLKGNSQTVQKQAASLSAIV